MSYRMIDELASQYRRDEIEKAERDRCARRARRPGLLHARPRRTARGARASWSRRLAHFVLRPG